MRSKVNVFVALDQQRHEGRRQVAELEQSRKEQQQLLEELSVTQAELQRSLRMRDDFMSLVAHELRTPLNTLFLESQMRMLQLQRGNFAALGPDRLPAMVARDQRQIQSMIRLIDDMLDVSRIRSGSLSIRPTEFELIGPAQARGQRPGAAGDRLRQHASTLHPHAPVAGLLGRVPHRAGDHQPADQCVALRRRQAGRHRRRGRRRRKCGSTCIDAGIGISAADQQRIFEPFERGSGSGEVKGLGLGLAISRQLAEAHGGRLGVTSDGQTGSIFSLMLPLFAADAARRRATPADEAASYRAAQ